ncbi:alpha-ketoglutarate-dependent dioxygenase AlkB family protein [Enterovibrio calviensis]|uniref:alpha-ketoglutarate-dependent dioxygenase AlkB family protein n=1 Tax=Enterovibrio calviensis TaxID=91359 RepID=UPI000487EB64|nr:alpha-ketoglutarate-dependent dioxygenase AlkB [Enterovibrio calviensis]
MNQGDLFEQTGWIDLPDGKLYWQPDFISANEAALMFESLLSTLPWQQLPIKMFGREVLQPRLQAWFGEHGYTYSGLMLPPAKFPPLLDNLKNRCSRVAGDEFNTVLANLYRDGQDYMGWHQDNERELGPSPNIASLTLGESRRFVLKHIHTGEKREFELGSGSLLIMAGKTQTFWQHALPKTAKTREARINLTFRKIIY